MQSNSQKRRRGTPWLVIHPRSQEIRPRWRRKEAAFCLLLNQGTLAPAESAVLICGETEDR
jgi:hypothetical protein